MPKFRSQEIEFQFVRITVVKSSKIMILTAHSSSSHVTHIAPFSPPPPEKPIPFASNSSLAAQTYVGYSFQQRSLKRKCGVPIVTHTRLERRCVDANTNHSPIASGSRAGRTAKWEPSDGLNVIAPSLDAIPLGHHYVCCNIICICCPHGPASKFDTIIPSMLILCDPTRSHAHTLTRLSTLTQLLGPKCFSHTVTLRASRRASRVSGDRFAAERARPDQTDTMCEHLTFMDERQWERVCVCHFSHLQWTGFGRPVILISLPRPRPNVSVSPNLRRPKIAYNSMRINSDFNYAALRDSTLLRVQDGRATCALISNFLPHAQFHSLNKEPLAPCTLARRSSRNILHKY